MADVWSFGPANDDTSDYSDGTMIPHRHWRVCLNGEPVGEVEVHLHRRAGARQIRNLS